MLTTESYLKPVNTVCFDGLEISKDKFIQSGLVYINELTPNQKTLDTDCLQGKIKGTVKLTSIYVLKYKGLNILIDGHHTVIAKLIKGQIKVRAKIYSMK